MNKVIYTPEYRRLIKQLKLARKEADLTQKDIAKFLGLSQSYISKIESGQVKVDVILLKKFAEIYKKALIIFLNSSIVIDIKNGKI